MKSSIFHYVFLPFLALFFAISFIDLDSVQSITNKAKSDNPNNYYMVDYEDGNSIYTLGNDIDAEILENDLGQYIYSGSARMYLKLKEEYTFEDFLAESPIMFFTLYDTTNSSFEAIETIPAHYDEEYWLGKVNGDDTSVDVVNVGIKRIKFDSELEEFHDYRIGFNVQEGDDMVAYSNTITPAVPTLTSFNSVSGETSLTIDYEFVNPSATVTFDYNEIYLKINGRKIDLNNETSGEIIIDDLKPAQQYSIALGYDVTKIVSSDVEYNVSHEEYVKISTKVPATFGNEVIAIAFILLMILIIILLILIIVILYWNHQRRKISEMSLVMGEENYNSSYEKESNDTFVWNSKNTKRKKNKSSENASGYFNQVSDDYYDNNQGDEVYGYFDEMSEDNSYDMDDYERGEF